MQAHPPESARTLNAPASSMCILKHSQPTPSSMCILEHSQPTPNAIPSHEQAVKDYTMGLSETTEQHQVRQ